MLPPAVPTFEGPDLSGTAWLPRASRHARATELTLTVEAGDTLIITLVDNGLGMPPHVARSGLRNLEQRAAGLGGSLVLADEPGGGTRVTWQVPLS